MLHIQGHAFLARIMQIEKDAVSRFAGWFSYLASRLTRANGFDLDDVGAHPGEGLGACCPGLGLREFQYGHIFQEVAVYGRLH